MYGANARVRRRVGGRGDLLIGLARARRALGDRSCLLRGECSTTATTRLAVKRAEPTRPPLLHHGKQGGHPGDEARVALAYASCPRRRERVWGWNRTTATA